MSILSKLTKRESNAGYVSEFEWMFKCPLCDESMNVVDLKSLICHNHHTFDFTKQGYLNLTTRSIKTKYSKELFEARRKVIAKDGFFEPLSRTIAESLKNQVAKENLVILDTGCGEGSHLVNLCDLVRTHFEKTVVGVGIDLSKEGIFVAAKNYSNYIWAVADLAKTPFRDGQFDVILNLLSPSNYAEFNRLLRPDGLVIKVVPQNGYLKELRLALFDEPEKQSYSNHETVDLFNEHYQMVSSSRVQYAMSLNQDSIQSLLQMTPLTWNASKERVQSFLERETAEITVDLEVLVGKRKSE
uniref:putative RNA methyltransferase n=1 Tax=Niallia sp. XMNu-256 TaxID=3082444 RepID=UPI00403FB60F